jgi:hypothetical protein
MRTESEVKILTVSTNRAAIEMGEAEPLAVEQEQLWARLNQMRTNQLKSLCIRLQIAKWGTKYLLCLRVFHHKLDAGTLTCLLRDYMHAQSTVAAAQNAEASSGAGIGSGGL